MQADPHAGPGGDYFIRSVYLDSLENGDYVEKVAGSLSRKKIRLRVYSENAEFALLERKHKIGMVFQRFCLLPNRSALENVLFRFRYVEGLNSEAKTLA